MVKNQKVLVRRSQRTGLSWALTADVFQSFQESTNVYVDSTGG
jgi:hypothetical protein